jgi:hypothetical protein
MSNRAYSDATYANFRNIGDIVTWILKGKYVSFSDFHMNEAKQYTGPDDYFGCDMFRQAVEFLRTADWESLTTPTSLPVTSNKHRLKLWEGWNPGSYREYTTMSENRVKYSLIGAKYNDAVIQEVTGLDSDTIPFKTFKPAFEAEISAKQDFEFFLLSSSEETIKSKIQETYQRLTA